jgi:hypothetical protein
LVTGNYTLQGMMTFGPMSPATSYSDPATGIVFTDFQGHNLTVSGGVLSTPIGQTNDFIRITIPATYLAIEFDVTAPSGLCLDAYCPANQTSGFVGFINAGASSSWFVDIGPLSAANYTAINNFNAAISNAGGSGVPEVSSTLLIGGGLISMRWMRRLFLESRTT